MAMANERARLERAWSVLRCQAPGEIARWRYRDVGMVPILYCSNATEPLKQTENLEAGDGDWGQG